MVAHSVSSSKAVASSVCAATTKHDQLHEQLLAEIEGITEQLTKTRGTLWEAQDKLRISEKKSQQLEMHIAELVAARKDDAKKVKQIQEDNTRCLEEEAKIRESLELMKKVFTRNQLKNKEDLETLALVKEERDLLLEENERLRSNAAKNAKDENKESKDSQKNERVLSDALERTRKELHEYKKKQQRAESKIRKLKNKVLEERENSRSNYEPGLIDRLERNVMHYVRGTEDRDEQDTNIIARAFLDEDLEDGLARELIPNLNCGAGPGAKKFGFVSFHDKLPATANPFLACRRPEDYDSFDDE